MVSNLATFMNPSDPLSFTEVSNFTNQQILNSTNINDIIVPDLSVFGDANYRMFFDQATGNSGVAIFNDDTGLLVGAGLYRKTKIEPKDKLRIAIKNHIIKMCEDNTICGLNHEEVFGSEVYGTSEDLNQLKTIFKDIKNERYADLDVQPENNKKWKKRLVYPDKLTRLGSDSEKRQIRDKILELYPALQAYSFKQDTFDAIGIGVAYYNVKFNRLPKKLCEERIKTNKRTKIDVEVSYFPEIEQSHIKDVKLQNYALEHGVHVVLEYDTDYTLEENIKIVSERMDRENDPDKNKLLVFYVPEHVNTGQICLEYGCPYRKNQYMVAFGKLKHKK